MAERKARMKKEIREPAGPRGGLRAGQSPTRGWRWSKTGTLLSAPVRCKREQWYLARGRLNNSSSLQRTEVMLRFAHNDQTICERSLSLHRACGNGTGDDLLGWIQAPEDATQLQLQLLHQDQAKLFAEVVFHAVAERDPKCHPLANVPRWNSYQHSFPLERVVLPPALEDLAPLLNNPNQNIEILRPSSKAQLAKAARRAALVLDPAWIADFGLRWADLERLAAESWVLIDLETTWKLLQWSGLTKLQLLTQSSPQGIMSARVEYADVATRGFALEDVFPYSVIDDDGFSIRVLRADRTWKRYADAEGFATLLASETPNPKHCGDVLSAARPIGRGELITTDLPWLLAGEYGPLLAPRLARHTLNMHLAGPIDDNVQYWNRWDDGQIMVRDISDLARRYPALRPVRWSSVDNSVVHLGIALSPATDTVTNRVLLICTGRIDHLTTHRGMPPEPMIIFMKMLARDMRERSSWAERYLQNLTVIWQFDSAAGLRYAANYASAAPLLQGTKKIITLQHIPGDTAGNNTDEQRPCSPPGGIVEVFGDNEGIYGDGALEYQDRLNTRLRTLIEQQAPQ